MTFATDKKRHQTRKGLLFTMAAILLTAGACGHEAARPAPPEGVPLPAGTPIVTAELTSAPATYNAVGSVQARTTAMLATRVSGYVTQVRVKVGDQVRRGEVLVVLSTPEAGDQVKQAQAGLAAAQAQTRVAQQQAAAAQAEAAFAASTYQRYQQLRQQNSVSPHEFDEVASRYQAAQAGEAAARARQQAVESQMRQARAGLAQARTLSGFSTMTAPFHGVVTWKNIDVGALAMPGIALLTIENPDRLQLAVSVPDQLLGGLRIGQTVEAKVDALPDRSFFVRIAELTPVSDPAARAAIVKVDLPATPGLRSGLYGHVTLPAGPGSMRQTLLAPPTAVLHQGELDEMYVLNPSGRAELRVVKTGAVVEHQVEILAGLNVGERYAADARTVANSLPQSVAQDASDAH